MRQFVEVAFERSGRRVLEQSFVDGDDRAVRFIVAVADTRTGHDDARILVQRRFGQNVCGPVLAVLGVSRTSHCETAGDTGQKNRSHRGPLIHVLHFVLPFTNRAFRHAPDAGLFGPVFHREVRRTHHAAVLSHGHERVIDRTEILVRGNGKGRDNAWAFTVHWRRFAAIFHPPHAIREFPRLTRHHPAYFLPLTLSSHGGRVSGQKTSAIA